MENTVKNLEAMFQKADSGIDNLTQRLNHEFENNEEIQTNPAELVEKLGEVKKEYSTLIQEAAKIQVATQDAVQQFQGHLNDMLQLMVTLQSTGGIQGQEKPEELVRLEQLLGTQFPWGHDEPAEDPTEGAAGSQPCTAVAADSTSSSQKGSSHKNTQAATSQSRQKEPPSEPVVSPASLRHSSEGCVEVTEEEFNSVSDLIRGRVKLADVNTVYNSLWEYFKTSKRKRKNDLLTPEDMSKMGMKVTGVTGQAKLKVLRALKLLRLTTKGEVALL